MAFTLVPEDGTGLPTANAYATVARVDEILELNIHSNWALAGANKEKLIGWATQLLNQNVRWFGTRKYESSGTPFPRCNLRDNDGNFYPDDAIPAPLEEATAVLADFLLGTDPTVVNSASNLKQIDVDVISLRFDNLDRPEKWPRALSKLLRNLGRTNFSSTGGKPIIRS